MPDPALIPLFPLGTVLYPGLVLPLHIFEQRYRELIADLLALPEDAPRTFGVTAIKQGRETGRDGVTALYPVGCTAEVRRVDPYPDGRFDIVTVGMRRFRLLTLDDERPYHRGRVQWLEEEFGEPSEATILTESVRAAFDAYLAALGRLQDEGRPMAPPTLPDDPSLLSYLVAATMVADLADKQALLAEPTAVARLRHELALLVRETTMLRAFSAAPSPELSRAAVSLN